jgi:hypothetical protein
MWHILITFSFLILSARLSSFQILTATSKYLINNLSVIGKGVQGAY